MQEQHSRSGADATKQSNIIKKVSSGKTLSKGQLWSLTVGDLLWVQWLKQIRMAHSVVELKLCSITRGKGSVFQQLCQQIVFFVFKKLLCQKVILV